MKRDSLIQSIAAIALIGALTISGAMMPSINASASDAQLKYSDNAAEGAPTPVVIAQSIGVLRGIIVNYLWIRADKLKEDGKFFEAYHIGRWITDLQPRFSKVWAFQAWNMAYNISVATHTKEERWQWVMDGIRLVREHGIKYNPDDMWLYKELSWYFLHKIGGFTDDAHNYYKMKLAEEWHGLLGEPPFEHESRLEWLQELVQAPDRIEQFYAEYPEGRALVRELREARFSLGLTLLRMHEKVNSIQTSYLAQRIDFADQFNSLETIDDLPEGNDPRIRAEFAPMIALRNIRENPEYAEAYPALLNHVRKRLLREEYNMDPVYMHRFTKDYGPIDWRSPAAHSLYWAAIGVERGLSRRNQFNFDRINTDRLIFHSVQLLKRVGRIRFDYATRTLSSGPDLRFIPFYEATFTIVLQREIEADLYPKGMTYTDGYRNFLIDAVREYYIWGEYEKADAYYRQLRNDPQFQEFGKEDRFTKPIQEFIIFETTDRWTSPDVARSSIIGLLASGFRFSLAYGDDEVWENNYNTARLIWQHFYDQTYVKTVIDANRMALEDSWNDIVDRAFWTVMVDENVTLIERMMIWERAEAGMKARIYDAAMPLVLDAWEQRGGIPQVTFGQAFPEPPGVDAVRAARAAAGNQPESTKNIERN